jgi:hypothetical protein
MSIDTDISMFCKSELNLPLKENIFLTLVLFFASRSEINVKSTHSTLVCWLQNDQGYQMYKPTDTAIDAFLESYRPGKDKNIEATVADSSTSTTNSSSVVVSSGGVSSSSSNNNNSNTSTSETNNKAV